MRLKLIAVVILFAFAASTLAQFSNAASENENGHVRIRVDTDEPSYLTGETVTIRTYLTNMGNETIGVYIFSDHYTFYNSQNDSLGGFGRHYNRAIGIQPPLILTPQNETEISPGWTVWDQSFKVDEHELKVTSGTYRVETNMMLVSMKLNETSTEKTMDLNTEASFSIAGDPTAQLIAGSLFMTLMAAIVVFAIFKHRRERENLKAGKPQV